MRSIIEGLADRSYAPVSGEAMAETPLQTTATDISCSSECTGNGDSGDYDECITDCE